ncbi:MAG TPA: class I SAM-dependent methyltransferase [Thiobacillaceae bacterium]|nr:class I SAM-dependent methyltransferase [Thiobacillaceae bacterium]
MEKRTPAKLAAPKAEWHDGPYCVIEDTKGCEAQRDADDSGDSMSTPGPTAGTRLSHDDVFKLSLFDFLAYLGKRVISPGGIEGRDRMLDLLRPRPHSRLLAIGAGSGQIACHVAQAYGCKVAAIDNSPRRVSQAQALVKRLSLSDRVHCEVGSINQLKFTDNTFDAVICHAVLMFVPYQPALAEVQRVLKEKGVFAGLECCWKRLPPPSVREATNRICGAETLDFPALYGWIGALRKAGFEAVRVTEHPFRAFSLQGFLEDEGWANGLRILANVMRSRPNRMRMAEIRSHFSTHAEYFSYVVLSGRKPSARNVRQELIRDWT